jgi:hypothetical protein
MGPAAAIKAAAGSYFSLTAFGDDFVCAVGLE